MTPHAYAKLVATHAEHLNTPAGPRRRVATEDHFLSGLRPVMDGIAWLTRALQAETVSDPAFYAHELSLEITSYLYAAGASHDVWRRWSLLASEGSALREDPPEMAAYAVLSGRWNRLGKIAARAADQALPGSAILNLAFDLRIPLGAPGEVDDMDQAWLHLATSIPGHDHDQTERSLQTLAEFWMQEDEEWEFFEPRSYPCFDPYVCAAAALARNDGYIPRNLSADARRFLDPGLAPQHPDPFFSPRSAGDTNSNPG